MSLNPANPPEKITVRYGDLVPVLRDQDTMIKFTLGEFKKLQISEELLFEKQQLIKDDLQALKIKQKSEIEGIYSELSQNKNELNHFRNKKMKAKEEDKKKQAQQLDKHYSRIENMIKKSNDSIKLEINELMIGVKKEQSVIKNELSNVKTELSNVKQELSNAKQELSEINKEQSEIKKELSNVKQELSGIKREQGNMKTEQSSMINEIRKTKGVSKQMNEALESISVKFEYEFQSRKSETTKLNDKIDHLQSITITYDGAHRLMQEYINKYVPRY